MKKIQLIKSDHIIEINKEVSNNVNQKSVCLDINKIESSIGAAYYPGQYPFQYGGIARVAGALCFFLTKAHAFLDGNKRTAMLSANLFLDINSYDIKYSLNSESNVTALTEVIEKTASSQMTKEELMDWYDQHKCRKIKQFSF